MTCKENGGLFWGVVLVLAKNCWTQAIDTPVQVDIFLEIVLFIDFGDRPFFEIKIKRKPFRDGIATHPQATSFGPSS